MLYERAAPGAAFAVTAKGVGFGLATGVLTVIFNAIKASQGGDSNGSTSSSASCPSKAR